MAEKNKVVPIKQDAEKAKTVETKKTDANTSRKAVKKPEANKPEAKSSPEIKKVKAAKNPASKTKKVSAKKPAKVEPKKAMKVQEPKKVKSSRKIAKPKKAITAKSKKKAVKSTITPTKKMENIIMAQPNFNPKDFEKAQAQFDQFTKEAANMNREGIDAIVKSGTIFAKGFESIVRETINIAQASAEKQMQLARNAMTSKTINEFSDAQNKIAQTGFDDFMSGTTKITELSVKVLTDSIEPINDQIAKSVQKASDAIAAE